MWFDDAPLVGDCLNPKSDVFLYLIVGIFNDVSCLVLITWGRSFSSVSLVTFGIEIVAFDKEIGLRFNFSCNLWLKEFYLDSMFSNWGEPLYCVNIDSRNDGSI